MKNGLELLNRLERYRDEHEVLIDKIPTEDKIIMAHEQRAMGLQPWQISEIAETAVANMGVDGDAFGAIYNAISEALEKARR